MKRKTVYILGLVLAFGLCACAKERPDVAEPQNLTLTALAELVQEKGESLSWDDFSSYSSKEIGFGLYILQYPINEDYYLAIGGAGLDTAPMYIRLVSAENPDNFIDIRTESGDDLSPAQSIQNEETTEISTTPEKNAGKSEDIDFRYLHRGFTAIQLDDRESFEAFSTIGVKVILDDEDWHAYMEQFCPGIPYFDSIDFSQECLLASVSFGARPAYIQASTLVRLTVENGRFVFEYDDNPTECLALNSDDTAHFYVEVLIINREDLPDDIEDSVYRPAPAPSTMEDILAGEGFFYSEGKYITLEEFCADYGRPVAFTKAAAADIDRNGTNEVILWLSGEEEIVSTFSEPYKEGVLILHQEEALVYGDFMPNYALYDLKADGTFRWVGKHGSSGVAYADSRSGFWCQQPIATEEKEDYSSPDDTMIRYADRVVFSLDETINDEEAYRQAMEIQEAKEDAHWYDYPCADLELLLNSKSSNS